MAYLGLVPSEASTGDTTRRGGITKAGNSHVRRGLVKAAWHYRHRPGVGLALTRRREGQPGWVVAVADKAQVRLHHRFNHLLIGYRKPPGKAIVAIARELVGSSGPCSTLMPPSSHRMRHEGGAPPAVAGKV